MEWTADKVRKVQQVMYETNAVSLNEIIEREENEHSDNTSLLELLPADQILVEDEVLKSDGNKLLRVFVEKLPPREQLVIRMRFGLDDETPKTLEEVGKHFGVTRERARQVEARALRHLKQILQKAHANYNTFR